MRLPVLLLLFIPVLCAQQDEADEGPRNPLAGKPEAAEAGRKLFGGSCAVCHGTGGEGGRGPKLRDGVGIRGASDQRLFTLIRKGVAGADMPPSNLPDENIWQLVSYLRAMTAPAFESPLPGDAQAGSALFFGRAGCSGCHMIRGRGGYLGPDLTTIGSTRTLGQLRESVLEPNARWADGYRGVTVTLRDGRRISGVARDNTNYSVQILDAKGELHMLSKLGVRELVLDRQSLMPGDFGKRLTSEEITNVLAFLSRQAVRPPGEPDSKRRRREPQ